MGSRCWLISRRIGRADTRKWNRSSGARRDQRRHRPSCFKLGKRRGDNESPLPSQAIDKACRVAGRYEFWFYTRNVEPVGMTDKEQAIGRQQPF